VSEGRKTKTVTKKARQSVVEYEKMDEKNISSSFKA
jgi:hypothetical protein